MMDIAGPVHITMKMEPVIVKSIMNINMRLVVFGNTVHTERRKLIMEEKNIEKIVIMEKRIPYIKVSCVI